MTLRRDMIRYVMRLIDYGKGYDTSEFAELSLGQVADQIIAMVHHDDENPHSEAVERLRKVEEMHSKTYESVAYVRGEPVYNTRCQECAHLVPCPTRRMIQEGR